MSISTILVRVIVDAVEKTGVLRDEFLRSLKIDPARLSRAEGRFDLEEFVRLEVRALDVTQDEALGLHIAERAPVTAFDLMSHLTSHAPTMREAFRLVVQFQHLLMDDCHIALKERGGSATIHGKASCAHAEGVRGHRLEEGRSAVQEATLVGMDAVY